MAFISKLSNDCTVCPKNNVKKYKLLTPHSLKHTHTSLSAQDGLNLDASRNEKRCLRQDYKLVRRHPTKHHILILSKKMLLSC